MESKNFMFDLPKNKSAAIKVIGVGGGGSNAVNYMYAAGIDGVDFVICNTDAQALNSSPIPNKIQLGVSITEGLGAGANPEVGEQAALESIDEVKSLLNNNTKMVFITAGMGGGTGTGAAPIIAGIAKEMGILTVGIVTSPFYFEGKMRLEQAENGIKKLRNNVDSLIVVNNDKLRELYGNLGYKTGFAKADEILSTAAKGIAEVITKHYSTNIDLRDAKTVLSNSGTAIMGSATASGENKAIDAISNALDSPLLNDNKITGAKNVLLLIVSGETEITVDEIGIINDYIQKEAGNGANVIMGIGEDLELGDKISVTIVATGFPLEDQKYTGRDEEKIYHRLEEEQALTKTLNVKSPQHTISHFDDEPTVENSSTENGITTYILEDIFEETPKQDRQVFLFENDEDIKLSVRDEIVDKIYSEPTTLKNSDSEHFKQELEEEDAPTSFVFNIKNESAGLNSEESILSLMDNENTMEDSNNSTQDDYDFLETKERIEERRKRLKKFNFKFQSDKELEEQERIPAFKRQGVDIDEKTDNSFSNHYLGEDSQNDIQIRPNNFLHDNVD